MTKKEALALSATKWWEGASDDEIARTQLAEPRMICPVTTFHKAVERALGRNVMNPIELYGRMPELLEELDGKRDPPADWEERGMDILATELLAQGRNPDEVIVRMEL